MTSQGKPKGKGGKTGKEGKRGAASSSEEAARGEAEESTGAPPAAAAAAADAAAPGAVAARPSSYLVLARRYRPTQFEQVVGQTHVTRTLQNAIAAGRVHHAYLFSGCRGVGKTTVARIMAKALNCATGPAPNPCDACEACVDIREGRSVDVFEIDGASHTGVDDVRQLRENVRYLPAGGRHKIYIIDEVHMLSTSAFNALLKTLEEPPPQVVFIFATTEPHKIPATILSRCQRFDFKRVSSSMLVEHLRDLCGREEIVVGGNGLALIARASEGSVRDALSLLDQVIAYSVGAKEISAGRVAEVLGVADRRVLFELSRAILGRDAREALGVVDRLFEGGHDLSQFARAFLAHLRDLTVVRTCRDPGPLVEGTDAELSELAAQAQGPGGELLSQHFDHFARATEEIARSPFPRLLLEMAIVEMVHAEPLLPLGDLLERLEGLEARLGGGGGPVAGPRWRGGEGDPARGGRGRGAAASAEGGTLAAPGAGPRARPGTEAEPRRAPVAGPATPAEERPVAGSASVPPLAGAAGGHTEDMDRWQQLLSRVMEQEPVAASAFAAGKLLRLADDAVELAYAAGSFELQWARDPEKLQAFERECSRQAGRPVRVTIRELKPSDEKSPEVQQATVFEDRARRQAARTVELTEEARQHPLTRTLVDAFGAQIDGISTEADEP